MTGKNSLLKEYLKKKSQKLKNITIFILIWITLKFLTRI